MPQLSDLVEKRKFVKKEYRPWDLSGTGTVDAKDKPESTPPSNAQSTPAPTETSDLTQPSVTENTIAEMGNVTGNELGNKTGNKQVTNRQQRGNKEVTKREHIGNKQVTNRQQTGNVTGNKTGNELGNKTDNTEERFYLVESIKKLSGIQKNIFVYIINVCSARGVLDTGNILSSDLANSANCSIGSAKTSLIRLVEKQLIFRIGGKASRGGHTVLGITKEIQSAAIQAQQALFNPYKLGQIDNVTGNITGNETGNKTGNTPYSSSSIKNNITTTSLPEDWKKINFELLEHIGFSETQLCQLFQSGMTAPEIIQDAICRFAYSLEHHAKVKAYNDPLNVLMGILRKGQRWNEPNYVSPKELALRQILEEKQKKKKEFDEMIKELVTLEFPEWRKNLSEAEIKQIVPADILKMNLAAAIQSVLRTHFTEKIIFPRFQIEND